MDVTTQRRLLHAATGILLAGGIAAVAWSVTAPLNRSSPSSQTTPFPPDPTPSASRATDGAADAATSPPTPDGNFSLALLEPLDDPPKPPPKPRQTERPNPQPPKRTPPPPPRLKWTLQGTLIEPQRRLAILADGSGNTDIRGVGERIELSPPGVRLREITADRVTLEVNGKPLELELEQAFQATRGRPGSSGRRRNR